MVRFAANTIVIDDSAPEFILVGFADDRNGHYREALHFQRSYKFDERDAALGMDGVYVERNDQRQGGYGAVERVELLRNRLRVVVGGQVVQRLGDREFEIDLSLSDEEFERVRKGLQAVFNGFSTLIE